MVSRSARASAGAFAQAPGERSAVIPTDCNHACLIGFVHSYMDALVHKDPSRAHFAKDVRFTENDVEMPLGHDGLWGSISGVAPTGLEVADTTTGNAAWFGTVEEHGEPAYYAMRLKVRDGADRRGRDRRRPQGHACPHPSAIRPSWSTIRRSPRSCSPGAARA